MTSRPIYKTSAGEHAVMAAYDRILAEWPESTECLQIETRHGLTHVITRGRKEAPLLVLLHGAGSNALAWGADVPEFERYFRVCAVDTPGEPGRSSHERISWKGEGIVDWLEDVLDGLGASEALLAGISQGGYSALRLAAARPARVKALALLAPGGVVQPKAGFLLRGLTVGLFGRRGTEALVRCVMGDDGVSEVAKDYMDLIFTHFRSRKDPQPLLPDETLAGLLMPVLLILGAKDAIFDSAKTVARFENLVKGAQIRVLPAAGHALINVAPQVVPFMLRAAADPSD